MAVTFLKKGKDSAALAQKHAADVQAKKDAQGNTWRFWLKEQEEADITFVDGELSPEGYLCPDRFYEHNLFLNGKWNNFYVCPERTLPDSKEVCPICKAGDKAYLVALFTIIDHRKVPSADKTKVYQDTKKLYAAKPQTFDILNKMAIKRGGLSGVTVTVTRGDRKTPSVGSNFEFVVKTDLDTLKKKYVSEKTEGKSNLKIKSTYFTPVDYEKEIIFRSGKELSELPELKGSAGGEVDPEASEDPKKSADYADQL